MLTIQLDDDIERTLNQLAEQEHIKPEQLIRKLIARYANTDKEPELLTDIIKGLPELPTFSNDPLSIQRAMRDEWN
jgi:predicted transcriptional regulator